MEGQVLVIYNLGQVIYITGGKSLLSGPLCAHWSNEDVGVAHSQSTSALDLYTSLPHDWYQSHVILATALRVGSTTAIPFDGCVLVFAFSHYSASCWNIWEGNQCEWYSFSLSSILVCQWEAGNYWRKGWEWGWGTYHPVFGWKHVSTKGCIICQAAPSMKPSLVPCPMGSSILPPCASAALGR